MSRLFMVYLGGKAPGANIEVHDVRFVVAESIDAAVPSLRQQWYGEQDNLHIDSYHEITAVGGYQVSLSTEPVEQSMSLFFVNLGGYVPSSMAEQHDFGLFIAENKADAQEQACRVLLSEVEKQHKDNLLVVDDCLLLHRMNNRYVVLAKPSGQDIESSHAVIPDWYGYRVISH
ncbi:hypothetical protein CI610_00252 [invertebrate metagenome]|uniref:DUF1543 domain-containing protein n=1 Tax=invertebrate metagenome TaxID=1711999 RepID=A0A2H9TC30_9ZZZZ